MPGADGRADLVASVRPPRCLRVFLGLGTDDRSGLGFQRLRHAEGNPRPLEERGGIPYRA
jgi:hypothetical protein